MITRLLVVSSIAVLAACSHDQTAASKAPELDMTKPVTAVLSTNKGDITLELDPVRAPLSVANFVRHAQAGHYDNTVFQRVIPTFVIQGGSHTPELVNLPASDAAARAPGAPLGLDTPIKNEWQNGLKNTKGSVGLGRDTDPDSGTREFYINVADNPKLDTAREVSGNAGYAVFGRVVEGWETVEIIRTSATSSRPEWIKKGGALTEGEMMKDVPLDLVVVRTVRIAPAH